MKQINENPICDIAAKRIAEGCRLYQSRFCRIINNMVSTIPPAKMKTTLIIFCLISSGLSIYIAFSYDQPSYIPMPIEVPAHVREMGTTTIEQSPMISAEMYQQIQAYKKFMDSLNQPIEPGLQDSLLLLENIYQSK